jgi:PAS domain S-box-containing protein
VFASHIGVPEPTATERETPLTHSFCQYTIRENKPFVVEDTRLHPLVKDNLAIQEFNALAYLGIPLYLEDGIAIGVFCAIDTQPHAWTEKDIRVMTDLAAAVMTELTLRVERTRATAAQRELLEERQMFVGGPTIALKWTKEDIWRVSFVSPNIKEHLGYNPEDFTSGTIPYSSIVHPEDLERVTVETQLYANSDFQDFEQEYRLCHHNGEYRWFADYTMILRDENQQPKYYQGYIRDISEQKKLEKTLYQTTARLRSIADSQAAYVVRTDLDGNYTYINKRFEDAYAWMQSEKVNLIGMFSLDTIAPIDHDKTREVVIQCLENPGQAVQITLRKISQTDELFYTLWEFVAITDNQGLPSEIQCVGFDVTEQVRAQQALALSEERYKLITNLMTDFVVSLAVKPDGSLEVEWRTGAYQELTGYTEDTLADSVALIHPDDIAQMQKDVERTLKGERTTSEYRRRHKNGHTIWLRAERLPIWDDKEGRVVRYYIAERDITEAKRHQEAFLQANTRQSAILKAIPDLIFRIRGDGTYLDYHAPSPDMLLVPPDQLIGQKIGVLYPPKTVAFLMSKIQQVLETRQMLQHEYSVEIDGKILTFEARVVPQNDTEVVVLVRDITEREKQAELLLEQERLKANLAKEQELNTTIQQAVSSLSHDVRTPLAVIATTKDLLLHYFDSMDEAKRREKLVSIDKQLHFVVDMLDDLVNYVKSNLSVRPFQPTTVNLATLCDVTMRQLQETIGRKHHLSFVCDDSDDFTVQVDETLVNRIVLNLVSNAIKFSPPSSEVRLELRRTTDQLIVKVIDQGMGISEEDQKHIFEAFYRAERAESIQGTGLGLNIVQECVRQHGGTIEVESQLDKGSTFIVRLPLHN